MFRFKGFLAANNENRRINGPPSQYIKRPFKVKFFGVGGVYPFENGVVRRGKDGWRYREKTERPPPNRGLARRPG